MKNFILKTFTLVSLFFLTSINFAETQDKRVIVTNFTDNSNQQSVIIKWYSDKLIYNQGVNIYRKVKGTEKWNKLNSSAIKKLSDLPEYEYQKDTTLSIYVNMVNGISKKEMKGFILLSTLMKSIESTAFSTFLGIQYIDNNAETGKTYQYKINVINNGKEEFFGISPEIIAGKVILDSPPQDIQIKPGNKKVDFKWKPEEERFYAINIYRWSTKDTIKAKLNKLPIMVFKNPQKSGDEAYPKVFYSDDSLNVDVTYYYQLVAINFFGIESNFSKTLKVTISDVVPPRPPVNIQNKINNQDIILTWKIIDSDDLFGFNIYRGKNDKNFTKVNTSLLSKTIDKYTDNVGQSGGFYYKIAAADKAGNEAYSNLTYAEIEDITPPLKPTGLIAKPDTGYIILSWNKNNDDDFKGYLIYRRINDKKHKENSLLFSTPITKNNYIDTLPKKIKNKFIYTVVAVDSALNKSKPSEIATAQMPDVIPPNRPFIKNIKMKELALIIEWIPNVEPDLRGYNIFREEKINAKTTVKQLNINLLKANVTKFSDRNVKPNILYKYYLLAIDSVGNKSLPSKQYEGRYTIFEKNVSEIEQFKVVYKKKKKSVYLSWKSNKQDDFLGAIIYKKKKNGVLKPLTGKLQVEKYKDKHISHGNTYYYQLRLYNQSGGISKSNLRKVTVSE